MVSLVEDVQSKERSGNQGEAIHYIMKGFRHGSAQKRSRNLSNFPTSTSKPSPFVLSLRMTERAGGSDVSMTETTAERVTPLKDGEKPKGGDRVSCPLRS